MSCLIDVFFFFLVSILTKPQNIFRIPGGWQYFTPTLGGTLDATFFKQYDTVMQACLATGSHCILDVHNYARWNGGIIGQGGPTNAQFANLWSQLASKYAADSKVIFGIMNEPHDLTMSTWAVSVQAAVTAIRAAGATSQMILLPGTGYTSAAGFETNSAPALSTVKDSDGTVSKLIYDVHKYMDSDGSGTSATCVSNEISSAFQSLATYLRTNKRQAFLSETGGGNTASCEMYVCQALAYLNQNSDVYLGWTGWAAGSFDTSYVLSETPNGNTDQPIVSQCIAGEF
jgi:endoglucanase